VVLYEMLTGEQPFRGDHGLAVIQAIENNEPAPIRTLDAKAPDSLVSVVHRAMEKKRDSRYGSMAELLEDLRNVRAGLGISDTGAPTRPPLSQELRRPRYAVPVLILLLAVGIFAVFSFRLSARARWARQEALPEIERLADAMSWSGEGTYSWSAHELALEAGQVIPDDPLLAELWPRISREIQIESDPPGAQFYAKPYASPDMEWKLLGSTPLGPISYPRGFTRIKLEKDGFRPVLDLAQNRQSYEWRYELHPEGSQPEEMVFIPGRTAPLQIPGLDHLTAEPLSNFLMDRYEVTNEEYKRFVDAGGYTKKEYWKHPFILDGNTLSWEEALALFIDRTGRAGPASWEVGDYPEGKDDHPVAGVSWYEAAAYAVFADKSLPTLFHWNQVAYTRAAAEVVAFANYDGNGSVPVGSKRSMNRWGTYDLAGNVREWCLNPTQRGGQRFILGGGWDDETYTFTDAFAQSPFDRSPTNGFRCIRYLEAEESLANLTREIELPFRDFFQEEPVSDEIFQVFLNQYQYDRTDLEALVETEEEGEDWIRQRIDFNAAYGSERMFAYLFLPKKGKPPYQTVVVFPGSNVIHDRDSSSIRPTDFILKSGRAMMLPIYKGTYERGDELDSDYQDETSFYKEHNIMWVKDFSRSIDYLETRDDIDSEKLAYLGVSWGGNMGAIVPAVEKRLKASVLYVAGLQFQKALPEADAINYVTRVTLPTLMLNGENDFYFPLETSQRPMFELLGTPEKDKKWMVYKGGHSVPRIVLMKETLDWLDRYLGPVE
jgi:formylglycine-generating enzyme required for sulfatase activity/dienelactone hydrolase